MLPAETVRADDALLDGLLTAAADPPPAAGLLAALRAAPGPAELDREAAARAAFRMFRPDKAAPAPLSHEVGRRRPGLGQPGRGQVRRRRPSRWQATALLSGAAAVIVALVLVFSLSGGGGGQPGPRLPDTHAAPPGGEQKVEGGATIPTTPTRPLAPTVAGSSCHRHGMYHHGCAALDTVPEHPHG